MPANVLIRIGATAGQAVSEINKVNRALGDQMTAGSKASAAITKAAVPAAIAFGAISIAAVDATKAAIEDAAAQDKLAHSLDRTTNATDAQIAATDAWVTNLSIATGVADDQLRPALTKLATATGDLGTAQDALGLALDVSAQTGKSLESTVTALAKGYGGNTSALGKLVPGLDKSVLATKDMTKVTDELSTLMGGAATEHAATLAGQSEVLGVKMSELKETLGAALIPALEALMPLMQAGADFAAEHAKAIEILVGIVAALSGGILAANVALKAYKAIQLAVKAATAIWTAAQWLLNAALAANPIGLVVVAIAALVAGIVIAYKESETFRRICQAAFDAVKVAVDALGNAFTWLLDKARAAWNWVKSHWQVAAFAFGPLGVAIVAIAKNFDKVKAAGVGAFNAITGAIQDVIGWIKSAMDWVSNLVSSIGRIHIPSIGKVAPAAYAPAGAVALMRTGYAGAGASYTINVSGAFDPEGTARAIQRVLDSHERRQGRTVR